MKIGPAGGDETQTKRRGPVLAHANERRRSPDSGKTWKIDGPASTVPIPTRPRINIEYCGEGVLIGPRTIMDSGRREKTRQQTKAEVISPLENTCSQFVR